jgi:hypothetical protein
MVIILEFYIKIQLASRSKHTCSQLLKPVLTVYREIFAVRSDIHTKRTNTLCGQNVELFNVKPGGT